MFAMLSYPERQIARANVQLSAMRKLAQPATHSPQRLNPGTASFALRNLS